MATTGAVHVSCLKLIRGRRPIASFRLPQTICPCRHLTESVAGGSRVKLRRQTTDCQGGDFCCLRSAAHACLTLLGRLVLLQVTDGGQGRVSERAGRAGEQFAPLKFRFIEGSSQTATAHSCGEFASGLALGQPPDAQRQSSAG